MFYTERLMLRNFDEQADLGTVLQWLNEPGFLHALSADALRPSSRDQAKTSLQSWMKNEGGLPCLVVCERPPEGQDPASLSGTSDLFMAADGKPRYPMIGVVSIRKGRFSFTNRVAELGIAFDKAHQGMSPARRRRRRFYPGHTCLTCPLGAVCDRSRIRHRGP